jgi:hypothetical protein
MRLRVRKQKARETGKSVIPREAPARSKISQGSMAPTEESTVGILLTGRRAPDHRLQSAKADFAIFQRRIHSLLEAGGARTDPQTVIRPRFSSTESFFRALRVLRVRSPRDTRTGRT